MAKKTIVLDADDTLWKTQMLYPIAREKLVALLVEKGVDAASARAKLEAIDAAKVQEINPDTQQKYLFTAARFPASLVQTLKHFIPDASAQDEDAVRGFGRAIFDTKAELNPGVYEMLSAFRKLGCQIVILTKGEEWVQEKRLAEFDFINMVDAAKIVSEKNADTFRELITQYDIDPAKSFSIGDSLKSDIIPSAAAGLNTILFSTNTWIVNNQGTIPAGTKTVTALREAIEIVQAHEKSPSATPTPASAPAPRP